MPLVSIPKDYFENAFYQSVHKFFSGNTTQNYLSQAFNSKYKVLIAQSGESITTELKTYQGVLNIELIQDQYEHRRGGMNGFDQEYNASTVTYAKGNVIKGTLRLRLITNTREAKMGTTKVDGLRQLQDFKGIVGKILNANKRIPIYDFRPVTPTITSMYIVHQTINRTYTEIPKAYNEVQEGVFDIPFYYLGYELETYDRITDVILEPERIFYELPN